MVKAKDTFKTVPMPKDAELLPLKWVFVYKFDDDGYLVRCKARICARGDLQTQMTWANTRATTLAARVFRALMALVAAFDLETCHLDSVNAFLNSPLAENVFCRFPDGFKKPGYCMKLNRAIYGLRSSPILWQGNFSNTLRGLGLEQIPEEPCLFSNGRIIVFFYVDDIVILARKRTRRRWRILRQNSRQNMK